MPRTRETISGGSDQFSVYVLRRLYNKGSGRGSTGVVRRYEMKPTITFETRDALEQTVPTGPGKYGSPVMELALRLLLCLVGKFSIDYIAPELVYAVTDRHKLVANLRLMADAIENFKVSEGGPKVE
jgi:hypothetical protein